MGGEVPYSSPIPYTRGFSEGGPVGGGPAMAMSSDIPSSATNVTSKQDGPSVSVNIQINNNGEASSSSKSNGGKDGAFGPDFANKLEKQVRAIVNDELVQASRTGGTAGQIRRTK
jgi:hypothetical protein